MILFFSFKVPILLIIIMKLITHNMLTSRCLRGVVTGYPLAIEVGVNDFNVISI